MNEREAALYEGLVKNEEETSRWKKYEQEHIQASENLINFSKKLHMDVMIPIGTKALMTGKLIHTNETFVSHYGKLFSNCSAYQANKICNHRLKIAKERLEKLQIEKDMFQNKLEKPYLDGVLPNINEREIIEVYIEEEEKLWRTEHRKKVKNQKLKEKEQRNGTIEKSDNEIIVKLEELEMMDELEDELEELNVEDDEVLQKLMSGEIEVSEKNRISHYNSDVVVGSRKVEEDNKNTMSGSNNEFSILNNLYKKYNAANDKINDVTNNNAIISSNDFEISDEDTSSISSTDVPKEIIQMEDEMDKLTKYEKLKYLTKMLKENEKDIDSMEIKNADQINEKIYKLEIRDYIYDHLHFLEDEMTYSDIKDTKPNQVTDSGNKKKKISFADHDDIQFIDKNDKVSDMLKNKSTPNFKREIIKLDDNFLTENQNILNFEVPLDKKKIIQEKVDQNMKYVQENQTQSDFDLIGKILNAIPPKTLNIRFKHTSSIPPPLNENIANNFINSPSDIYKLFPEHSPQKFHTELIDCPVRKDKNENAYEDIRTKFSNPNLVKELNEDIKPILKNKDVTIRSNTKKKSKAKKQEDPVFTTAYDIVMGEVVEKTLTEPEPLPNEKFVNSNAPKKRISRFKQTRNENISIKPKKDS